MDEIDWKPYPRLESTQQLPNFPEEAAENDFWIDNGTDPESLALDKFLHREERKWNRSNRVHPSIMPFYGRIRPAIMDDFGTLVPLNFYDLAISINSYRTDFSLKQAISWHFLWNEEIKLFLGKERGERMQNHWAMKGSRNLFLFHSSSNKSKWKKGPRHGTESKTFLSDNLCKRNLPDKKQTDSSFPREKESLQKCL